jgi:hypothetical protein
MGHVLDRFADHVGFASSGDKDCEARQIAILFLGKGANPADGKLGLSAPEVTVGKVFPPKEPRKEQEKHPVYGDGRNVDRLWYGHHKSPPKRRGNNTPAWRDAFRLVDICGVMRSHYARPM